MLLNQRGSARTLSLSSTHFCPMNDKEKPRVLIVDDNPDNLMVAASALAEQGFTHETVELSLDMVVTQ